MALFLEEIALHPKFLPTGLSILGLQTLQIPSDNFPSIALNNIPKVPVDHPQVIHLHVHGLQRGPELIVLETGPLGQSIEPVDLPDQLVASLLQTVVLVRQFVDLLLQLLGRTDCVL